MGAPPFCRRGDGCQTRVSGSRGPRRAGDEHRELWNSSAPSHAGSVNKLLKEPETLAAAGRGWAVWGVLSWASLPTPSRTHPEHGGELCRTPCHRYTVVSGAALWKYTGSVFNVFLENKPACPSGWGRRGRPGAWERGGRWLPFPGCRQLAVAMAAVCFPFLPALERKARVAACLFLNYEKVEKGLTCAAAPAAGLGQQPSLFAAQIQCLSPCPLPCLGWAAHTCILGVPAPCIPLALPGTVYLLSVNTRVAYLVAEPDGGS